MNILSDVILLISVIQYTPVYTSILDNSAYNIILERAAAYASSWLLCVCGGQQQQQSSTSSSSVAGGGEEKGAAAAEVYRFIRLFPIVVGAVVLLYRIYTVPPVASRSLGSVGWVLRSGLFR